MNTTLPSACLQPPHRQHTHGVPEPRDGGLRRQGSGQAGNRGALLFRWVTGWVWCLMGGRMSGWLQWLDGKMGHAAAGEHGGRLMAAVLAPPGRMP